MEKKDGDELKNEDPEKVYQSTTVEYIRKKGFKKYKYELQHLLPIRNNARCNKNEMPIDNTNCFEYVYFSWMTQIVWRSFKFGLKKDDLYKCSVRDSCEINGARIANIWEKEDRRIGLHNASLNRVIYKFCRTRVIISSIFYLFCLACGYLSSVWFLKNILEYIEKDTGLINEGIFWILALFICELARASSFAIMYSIGIRTAIRVSNGLNTLLYNKILTTRSLTNKTVGELINLFSNDISKVFHMVYIFPLILGGPVVTFVTVVYTWWLFGLFSLVGIIVFLALFCLQFTIAKAQSYYRKKSIAATDERVSLMTEILTYIKLIKLYAWEQPFSNSIIDQRGKERKWLEICQYLQCMTTSLALMTPMITTIATILAYTLAKHDLNASKAFTLVMVNYVAAHGIRTLPLYIRDIINGKIAIKRIEKILQLDDKENFIVLPSNSNNEVEFKKATLAWNTYKPSAIKRTISELSDRSNDENLLFSQENNNNNHNDNIERIAITQRSSTINATCLFDISFEIEKGKLIGIAGNIGSGKTALLKSIMGQMRLIKGKVAVCGLTAYVSQEPWILNATVRDNIVFGYEFNSKRYYEAINCCGLTNDLASLPNGDQTEIGERGVTISGGQKQRICLARAYYADRDIYLLDDPLSSVDLSLKKHIFFHCIKNGLKDKTVFLVTHQIEFLESMDQIILMKDGKIVKIGSHEKFQNFDEYQKLIENSNINVIKQTKNQQQENKETIDNNNKNKEIQSDNNNETDVNDIDNVRFSSPDWNDVRPLSLSISSTSSSRSQIINIESRDDPTKTHLSSFADLIADEKIVSGDISSDTYVSYMRAGGGYLICSFVLIWLVFQAITSSFANWWLGYWISQGSGNGSLTSAEYSGEGHDIIINNPNISFYQTIYGLSIIFVLISTVAVGYLFTKVTLKASTRLHDNVFNKIFTSPMRFFDTVPIGRILNIFSHDMDEIDTHVPVVLDGFLQRLMLVLCNLGIVIIIYPWFLIPFLLFALLFFLIYRMFRGAMRDFKRLENTLRSPIYSHIAETIQGLLTIKAFNKQNEFIRKFNDLVDVQSSPHFLYFCSMRWLSTRMDILCVLISLLAAIFAITQKETVGAAFSGLALVLSMQLSGLFQYVVRLGVDTETRFTSVERIQMQIETLKPESTPSAKLIKPPDLWPTRGRISFRDVSMRYRSGLPLALKGLTFDIDPQEKITIIGHTGAGKSSVAAVLFRLVEINSGTIHIDGIDINTISLDDLRTRISIIPQDPVLFYGSIRKNLDPFNQFKIQQILDALECVQMKDKVINLKGGIDKSFSDGSIFSAGERQLLCMARAVLRKNKILVLDEATASMDTTTEQLIHETIMKIFKDCTVLKIAHRLQNIQSCDRVMAVKDGMLVEFDKPSTLISNPQSYLSQMIASGSSF